MNKKIVLTFDTELWHESEWLKPYLPVDGRLEDRLVESLEPILALLREKKYTATFFVTRAVLERYPEMVVAISQSGHEVGCHGFKHRRLCQLDPKTFARELKCDADRIESLIGKRPKGFRAPHFSLEQKTSWLLPILVDLGFKYDSSLFPMRTGQYGVSGASLLPYRPDFGNLLLSNADSKILEIPVAVASWCGLRLPVAGGIYFRLLPLWLFEIFLGHVAAKDVAAPVLYFHPSELDAMVLRVRGPMVKSWLKYYGVGDSLGKLQRLSEGHSFSSVEKMFDF